MWKSIIDIIWPKKCINCGRHGNYLCADCFALIEINPYQCFFDEKHHLNGLYWGVPYKNKIVAHAVNACKYHYAKELSIVLTFFIISHFKTINKQAEDFHNFILCPVPMHKSKLKKRGFNQSEEIAKYLSAYLSIPSKNLLIKKTNTLSQINLGQRQRKENILNAFCINPVFKKEIKNAKILLIDDVFTTGATLEECAKILKQNSAQEVWGAVSTRRQGDDAKGTFPFVQRRWDSPDHPIGRGVG